MIKPLPALALLLSLPAAPLLAQDFGTTWMDRVTHEVQKERGPLKTRTQDSRLWVGAVYAYDTNIHLEEDHEDADSIVTPFVRLRIEEATQVSEGVLDILANWNEYLDADDASRDEERAYARFRYVSSRLELQLAEIFRHESDPIDVLFAERVERLVSNTLPRAAYDLTSAITVEAAADLQLVRMLDENFERVDNLTSRVDLTVLFRTGTGYDLLARAGYLGIDYRYETDSPSDADGTFARAGVRGHMGPSVLFEAQAGWTRLTADDVPAGTEDQEETGEAEVHLRIEATPQLTAFLDYSRVFTFSYGFPDAFHLVNRGTGILEFEATPQFNLRARAQYDLVSASSYEADYLSLGASAGWKQSSQVLFELGFTWRTGEIDGGPEYDDMIVQFGLVLSN